MSKPTTLLKVLSIIFIVFGAISIFAAVSSLLMVFQLGTLFVVSTILSLAAGVIFLLCGIFGLKGIKLKLCFILAIIILAFQAISFVTTLLATAPNYLGIIGIVLTILYLIGVKQTQELQKQECNL